MAISVFKEIIFILILATLILRIRAQWTIDEDECSIPTTSGCIPIQQCNSITSFLQYVNSGHIALTTDIINLLRSYQCGFQDSAVKVCCPKEMLYPKPVVSRFSTNEDPPPPEVYSHRNLDLLPYDCGVAQTSDRISGGNETIPGEFPWMVLLNYSTANGFRFKCGGTVINDRYILTAAHCIAHLSDLKPVSVRVGEHNVTSLFDCDIDTNGETYCSPPVQDITIDEVVPHPEFNPTEFMHDIALLRLSAPINTSQENAKPICLPLMRSVRNLNFTNTKLTITGWGVTELGKVSDSLLKVNIPMVDRSECQKIYQRSTAKISYLHLCGGGRNRQDSCGGDSGGPLQRLENFNDDARFVQYGIVSFGARTCGKVGVPGVYTRLDHYMNWILDTIRP